MSVVSWAFGAFGRGRPSLHHGRGAVPLLLIFPYYNNKDLEIKLRSSLLEQLNEASAGEDVAQ